MKRTIVATFFSLLFSSVSFGQKAKIDSLFSCFRQASFYGKVYPSKLQLESYQKAIIPGLIALLADTGFVKLAGTADLIYPGAEEFYGHGHFVPYDMDWISVRAGWLLEDLTFMNFGYKTTGVNDSTLFKLMKENYNEYLAKGTYDLEWKNKPGKEKLLEYRKQLAQKVKVWWLANERSWTRLSAIKEALKSNDETRIENALQFLRFRETNCDHLNNAVYESEIKPLVVALQKTKFEIIKTDVRLLLNDGLRRR
jgi:hypothetical protein